MTFNSPRLRELGYTGRVRLRGPLAERVADAATTYGDLAVDDILKGFRREAGLPAPGADMAGWASRTTEATFGQWVKGLARLGAALDDDNLRQRAADLADGWAATLPAGGETRMRSYGLEKLFCGLVDTAVHTGHREALRILLSRGLAGSHRRVSLNLLIPTLREASPRDEFPLGTCY